LKRGRSPALARRSEWLHNFTDLSIRLSQTARPDEIHCRTSDTFHDIVFADRHPGIRVELRGGGCRVELRAESDRDAESAGRDQKRTPRERACIGVVQHDALPL